MGESLGYYVVRYYKAADKDKYREVDTRVESCNPFQIRFEKDLIGFKFYEVLRDEQSIDGTKRQYGKMHYFGTRRSVGDLIQVSKDPYKAVNELVISESLADELACVARMRDIPIIICYAGAIIPDTDSTDAMIDGFNEDTREECNQIMVDRGAFFRGLTRILSIFDRENYTLEEKKERSFWDAYFHLYGDWKVRSNGSIDLKSYIISLNGEDIIKHSMVSRYSIRIQGEPNFDDLSDHELVDFKEVEKVISPLYEARPYLKVLIENIKDLCVQKKGKIAESDILSLARKYANTLELEERCLVLDRMVTTYEKDRKKRV